jgi:hypothetical protein
VFVYAKDVVDEALRLIAAGASSRAVGAELGLSPSTVRLWRSGRMPSRDSVSRAVPADLERLPRSSYAYLLGLYLGDGWIATMPQGTFSLRISLDLRYPGIIAAASQAMTDVRPPGTVRVFTRVGCAVVSSYWKNWPVVFPQHGSGRKHEREIVLKEWQQRIGADKPEELIRGLIHSDGCRFIANQRVGEKTYRYSRYSFSNRSEDIKAILCDHLDLLGIRWTRPNDCQIAIDRRSEVAKLDAFVGPKR